MSIKSDWPSARGFTLIELLVVIAIIGLLSGVIIASFAGIRDKARTARMRSEALQLTKAITIVQGDSGKTLMQITGNGCSDCNVACAGTDLRNTNNACYTQWVSDLSAFQNAADNDVQGIASFARDPWGSPWLLDENEGEIPANPCRIDQITSAGPDGIKGTADDYTFILPFSTAQCLIR